VSVRNRRFEDHLGPYHQGPPEKSSSNLVAAKASDHTLIHLFLMQITPPLHDFLLTCLKSSTLKMEVVGSSETSVNISNITRRTNPENHLKLHRYENLKSHINW